MRLHALVAFLCSLLDVPTHEGMWDLLFSSHHPRMSLQSPSKWFPPCRKIPWIILPLTICRILFRWQWNLLWPWPLCLHMPLIKGLRWRIATGEMAKYVTKNGVARLTEWAARFGPGLCSLNLGRPSQIRQFIPKKKYIYISWGIFFFWAGPSNLIWTTYTRNITLMFPL